MDKVTSELTGMDVNPAITDSKALLAAPVIVGGVGGSGTRVIAELLQNLDIDMGSALNQAKDNLLFTLLFRREEWQNVKPPESQIDFACAILQAAWAGDKAVMLQSDVVKLLRSLATNRTDFGLTGSQYSDWHDVVDHVLVCQSHDNQHGQWGWKEPNSHLFLPNLVRQFPTLKYIHVIRNGLDMAYSKNQNQLMQWEKWFVSETNPSTPLPKRALDFWITANFATKAVCENQLAEQNLWVSYEDVCLRPQQVSQEISNFLGTNLSHQTLSMFENSITKRPEHRYKMQDLSVFAPEDFQAVENLGYALSNAA